MPEIDIVIKAVDQATEEIKKLAGGMGDAIGEGAADLGEAWDEYKGTIGQIYRTTKEAYEQTVGVTVEYADQVERIKSYTGETAENASILLQIAGDYGVSVSDLESALSAMAKNGFDPTIDGLADIADEYLTYNPGTDQAQYLTKLFGRNAQDLAPMLAEGGDAIRDLAATLDENPPFTEEDLTAVAEYNKAVGELKNAFDELKVKIGLEIIPPLTDLLTGWENQRKEIVELSNNYSEYAGAMAIAGLQMYTLTEDQYNAAKAAQEVEEDVNNAAGAMDNAAGSADGLTGSLNGIPKTVDITITTTHKDTYEQYGGTAAVEAWEEFHWGKQAGGPVSAMRPYIVGEAGPELFVPQSAGQIIPNHELGGVTINLTYAPGISFADSRELSTRLQPMIIQAVRDAKLRGGYPS